MAFFKRDKRDQSSKEVENQRKSLALKDFLHSTILLDEALSDAILAELNGIKKLEPVVSERFLINLKKDLSNTLKLAHNKKSIMEMLAEELGDCSELIYTKEEMVREMSDGKLQEEVQTTEENNYFEDFTTKEFNLTENLIPEIDIDPLPVIEDIEVIIDLQEEQPEEGKKEHRTHEMISLKRPPKKKRSKTRLNRETNIPAKAEPAKSVEQVEKIEQTNSGIRKSEPVTTKPWIAPSCFAPVR